MSVAAIKPTVEQSEPDPVAVAARKALDRANGDSGRAIIEMADMVRKDKALRQTLLEPLVEYACGNAVRRQIVESRSRVWHPAVTRSGMTDAQRVSALAGSNLLMFPLPFGGKKLGDATREDVTRNAEFYDSQARDMGHKGRWLRLVAQSVPSGKTVSDALTDARLRELQAEAASDD